MKNLKEPPGVNGPDASVFLNLFSGAPTITFRAPGIQDEKTVEHFARTLSDLGLAGTFDFRIKFNKIQIRRIGFGIRAHVWTMMGEEKTLPIFGKFMGDGDWTRHTWFIQAANAFSRSCAPD